MARLGVHFGRKRPDAEGPRILGLELVCQSVIYPHVFKNADREVRGVLVGRALIDGACPK